MAYKPFKSKYAIVFEERQIQSMRVNLVTNFPDITKYGAANLTGQFNASSNSCVITLSDPYLDGVAWTSLNEINSLVGLGTLANQDSLAGFLKRKCEPGESPADGCFPYALIDSQGSESNLATTERSRPTLILTLWYVIGGDKNQVIETTFYFDLVAASITHGSSGEPTVTLSGKHAYDIKFQQNLQPTFFDQGKNWVDEFNEKLFYDAEGFKVEDVCSDSAEEVKMDRVYRVNNLTPAEILNKFISTKPGSQVLSLPTKEFANKIQICTKGDNFCYGSTVFYLGKGLYEKYKINVEIPKNSVTQNLKAAPPKISGPKGPETTYSVSIPDPETTANQLKDVSADASTAFTPQFVGVEDYSTTDIWMGSGNKETFKIEKLEKVAAYGDAKGPIAYYGGEVLNVNNEEKSVRIKSNFYIQYCDSNDKCNRATLYQEYKKLSSISVKETDELAVNASIGEIKSGDPQEVSKTKFYVQLSTGEEVVMDPSSIQRMISVYKGDSDKENEEEAPTDGNQSQAGDKIGEVGSSGRSTGPHLDASWVPPREISKGDVLKYVQFGENGEVNPSQTSGFGPRKDPLTGAAGTQHNGVDLSAASGTALFIKGGATIIDADRGKLDPNGYGYSVKIQTPEGQMLLSHLLEGSIPSDIPETSGGRSVATASNSGAVKNGNQQSSSDQNSTKISTEIKGVPKALRILPGRTILSFISDYDRWIENGKSTDIDPNVWIPEKYKSWYIGKVEYSWDRGDLRVKINGFLPWQLQNEGLEAVPNWDTHKENKGYSDYYDYIRSGGDLCYINKNNKDSCSECSKTRALAPSTSESADSINNVYPRGKFTYTCGGPDNKGPKIQALLDAGAQLGVTNKAGLAGIVSGALQESGLNSTIISGVQGENSQGIFQWNPAVGRLQDLKKWAGDNNLNWQDYSAQVKYFVYDVNKSYPNLVPALNNASSSFGAANAFDKNYTISGDRDQGPDWPQNQRRTTFVEDVLKCMS